LLSCHSSRGLGKTYKDAHLSQSPVSLDFGPTQIHSTSTGVRRTPRAATTVMEASRAHRLLVGLAWSITQCAVHASSRTRNGPPEKQRPRQLACPCTPELVKAKMTTNAILVVADKMDARKNISMQKPSHILEQSEQPASPDTDG